MISEGKTISLEYTVFLEDGTRVDSNQGEEPLVFVFGANQIFPALEKALFGLSEGDVKQVLLQADEAYGQVVPEAFREVSRETVPESLCHAGAILGVKDPEGGVYPIRVHEVKGSSVVLDFNHPLAGKALLFDVKVLGVQGP